MIAQIAISGRYYTLVAFKSGVKNLVRSQFLTGTLIKSKIKLTVKI